MKLYVVGNVNKHYGKVNGLNDNGNSRILILKNINDSELNFLYKKAQLFVYPSVYEGFGIPIIEALSHGTPVCVSDIDVFHEVCGDMATYFDPHNIEDIKNKIIETLKTKRRGHFNIEKYSWLESSKKVKEILIEYSSN